MEPKSWNKLNIILPIIVFIGGIWYFSIRILGSGLDYLPGDFGDARFINFLLEHGYQWLTGNHSDFWNAPYMYPFDQSIALSDNMLGTMPLYSLFRLFGAQQETAYQLWWITICSLNFWSAYLVVKRWFGRMDIALVAAWIFAFSIFNIGQIIYVQMMIRFMVPIVIYAAYRMIETSQLKYLAIFSFGIVFQFYSVMYTGFFLMYFTLGFMVIYAVWTKKIKFFIPYLKRNSIYYAIGILGLSGLLMGLLIMPYYTISKLIGMRTYADVIINVPTIHSYLFPPNASILYTSLHTIQLPKVGGEWWLHLNFPGFIPLVTLIGYPIILIYGLIRKIELPKLLMALGLTSVLLFIFYLRTDENQSLYFILFKFPGMASIRIVSRYMHVELFFILLTLAAIIVHFKLKRMLVLLLFAFVIVENSFDANLVQRIQKSDAVARRVNTVRMVEEQANDSYQAFAVIDTTEAFFISQIDGMIASNYIDLPTVNGYSSSCPGEFGEFFANVNDAGLDRWLKHNQLKREDILVVYR